MWQTVDYKGNKVKWYEAELIEQIKTICEKNIQDDISGLQDICIACIHGKANMALTILELIQEFER
jgi:hypothetical protein